MFCVTDMFELMRCVKLMGSVLKFYSYDRKSKTLSTACCGGGCQLVLLCSDGTLARKMSLWLKICLYIIFKLRFLLYYYYYYYFKLWLYLYLISSYYKFPRTIVIKSTELFLLLQMSLKLFFEKVATIQYIS